MKDCFNLTRDLPSNMICSDRSSRVFSLAPLLPLEIPRTSNPRHFVGSRRNLFDLPYRDFIFYLSELPVLHPVTTTIIFSYPFLSLTRPTVRSMAVLRMLRQQVNFTLCKPFVKRAVQSLLGYKSLSSSPLQPRPHHPFYSPSDQWLFHDAERKVIHL